MLKKRILLMYISEVSGHHQATIAIEKSIRVLASDVEIRNINGFGYTYPLMEKIVNKAYMGIIKRTPKVWDYLYDNPKVFKRLQSIKKVIHKSNHSKLARLFREFKPDVVACSQAFPCGMVADYKETYNLDTKIIGILTDYAPHSYWLHDGVDYYVVPSIETAKRLMQKGVSYDRVKILGIPVDPKFTVKLDKERIAEDLNLDVHLPTVLIMGGGQGLGPIRKVVKSLLAIETNLQLIVVAGTNKKLIRWLKKTQASTRKKIIVYEFINNIEELMEIAALTITKPGGMTTAEALVKGLPMVIIKPLPGQEMHNTDFLLQKGVAIRVNRFDSAGREVEALLTSPVRLSKMRRSAFDSGKPNSSFDIARLILE